VECKKKENLKSCNCSFDCEKKGVCCECVKYHREKHELPGCYFSSKEEKTGDRSIKNYFKSHLGK